MGKKVALILLLVGLLVLVGCEEGSSLTGHETILALPHNWGEGTPEKPYVGFVTNYTETELDMIDIGWMSDASYAHYTVFVSSIEGTTVTGLYYDDSDEDNPRRNITIAFSYSAPNLTMTISGAGDLAGRTYVLQASDD